MTFVVYYRLRLLEVTQDKLDRVQEKLYESRFREYQLANLRKVSFPPTESDLDVFKWSMLWTRYASSYARFAVR